MDWRMPEKCANCPFHRSGPGLRLRRGLRPRRWAEILRALRSDEWFPCHKTTEEDPEGDERLVTGKTRACAGALDWQAARGLSSNYQRVCERLEGAFDRSRAKKRKEPTR